MNFAWPGTSQKLPITLQTESAECGLACLVMVLSYHGHDIDLPSLRSRLAVSLKGMNLAQLIEAAENFSLAARPLRLDFHEIGSLQTPCVLHWDMNHFVVLKRVTAKHLEIHDPAKGFVRFSHKEASAHFTGVALELTPTIGFEIKNEKQRVRLRELFGQVLGLKRQLLQIFLISMGIELCGLLSPLYVQWVVDHALVSGDRDLVTLLAMGFFTVALIQVCVSSLRSWVVLHLSTSISVQWSVNVFSHLIRLPLAWFEKRHLGDIVSRFDSIGAIQKTLTTSFIEAVIDGIMTIVTLCMMFIYSAWMSLITLTAVVLYALLRVLVYAPLRRATEEQIVLSAKQQSTFLESTRGAQAIKLFGGEGQRQIMWHNRVVDTTNRLVATQKFMILYRLANGTLLGLELILSVWLGAQLVLANVFSIGMLFAFMTYKAVFASRISSLIDKAIELSMLSFQGERLADIVLTEKEDLRTQQIRGALVNPQLAVDNISFRYSELDPYVLRNLSLELPAGKSIAITGPSGCGKTTLAKLLLGLLKPKSGRILVNGQELERMGLHNYRPFVNAVMQDDQLFAGSIAENIAFFAQSIDMDKVEEVCRMACLHDDVKAMNMGYNTLIGDMGTALSGGQKQRLLLARALYCDPQILVLDEATSHLDVELEKAINQAIQNLSVTRIVIAHRPQTIAACDCEIHLPDRNHG
jgi:ATP-binding cassette, subfamily B, bacterial CvaB/MchF/RaxB